MPKISAFDQHVVDYDAWFDRHGPAYDSELQAVGELLEPGRTLEVGVGTGRFAGPLRVGWGVEPSARMRALARERGVDAIDGVAELLPYPDESFDSVLMVTTICFLDDVHAALLEACRVLKPSGHLVIGFVDRESPLGRDYEAHRAENVFYREATFLSALEVAEHLHRAGLLRLDFRQTLFTPLADVTSPQASRPGYGAGSFVVVRAQRPTRPRHLDG
jgi:SAM-dependent methyltransferase